MKIAVLGTRGFPHIQGGVETYCENLFPRLAALDPEIEILIYRRSPYIHVANKGAKYQGIRFSDLPAWKTRNLEAFSHSLLAAMASIFSRPDIVHIQNIGPALVLPLLKLFRLKTVVTYHSPNYEHKKWGRLARFFLKMGEKLVITWADKVIFVSDQQRRRVMGENTRGSYIPNGVVVPAKQPSGPTLKRYGLASRQYILAVGRFVPEKGFHDLLTAFHSLPGAMKLVIVGDADHEDNYSRSLKAQAARDERVVLTGIITGQSLGEIYSNARLFVLPSHHEGLPLVLLEALSYHLPALVSSIPGNLEVLAHPDWTFPPGDVEALRSRLLGALAHKGVPPWAPSLEARLQGEFQWENIAASTLTLYKQVL
jgi:glycosyltransferase involved in cell wall biosynthesis